MKRTALICSLLVLAACAPIRGDLRIDGSTADTTRRSYAAMQRSLDGDAQRKLSLAILKLQLADARSVRDVMADPSMQRTDYGAIGHRIDGMTYEQILALAAKSPVKVEVQRR